MATSVRVPLEVYLRGQYEPDAEYVDGEIQERPMGEDDHSAWQFAIQLWFSRSMDIWNIRIRPELRVQVKPDTFLVPDVAILDAANPKEKIATLPPLAVFEVFSPDDRIRRTTRKLNDYQQMGIPQIWMIDPEDKVWQRFEDGRLIDREIFSLPDRGIEFQMEEISKLVR
jgi:Uma2 family endonuclease